MSIRGINVVNQSYDMVLHAGYGKTMHARYDQDINASRIVLALAQHVQALTAAMTMMTGSQLPVFCGYN